MNPSPFPLEVSEQHEGARVRVRLRGELDIGTADLVAGHLRRLRERHAAVLLDLDELAFIDAGGLRMILTAASDARTVTMTLPRETDSIRVARAFVDSHSPRLTVARRQDARLMVSELVTNALPHGAGVIALRVTTGSESGSTRVWFHLLLARP